MTSHAFARYILALPDLPMALDVENSGMLYDVAHPQVQQLHEVDENGIAEDEASDVLVLQNAEESVRWSSTPGPL